MRQLPRGRLQPAIAADGSAVQVRASAAVLATERRLSLTELIASAAAAVMAGVQVRMWIASNANLSILAAMHVQAALRGAKGKHTDVHIIFVHAIGT